MESVELKTLARLPNRSDLVASRSIDGAIDRPIGHKQPPLVEQIVKLIRKQRSHQLPVDSQALRPIDG